MLAPFLYHKKQERAMEGELWRQVYALAKRLGKSAGVVRGTFTNVQIAAVYLWSVLHDRPMNWACERQNWRGYCPMKRLPSPATISRRLRSLGVQKLLCMMEKELITRRPASWCRFIDGKPLPISGHSQDSDAGYGRTTGGKAKGYRFHGVFDPSQGFVAWTIHPMNVNESKVAHELVSQLEEPGYLVGDNQFDSNTLYDLAGARSIQLIVRRRAHVRGLGHVRQSPFRLKAIEMMTRPFATSLIAARRQIETTYSQFTGLAFGLAPLPNWVRTATRVKNWVRSKLIFFTAYRQTQTA
jgi:Transposase DDE domain